MVDGIIILLLLFLKAARNSRLCCQQAGACWLSISVPREIVEGLR